mmetsp:Transcript_56040/g.126457  ORF Transcript_56040/g.126457 Transcript_56040/m.126457 type:complete len:208 (-) Transcript_56040:80-703(-)
MVTARLRMASSHFLTSLPRSQSPVPDRCAPTTGISATIFSRYSRRAEASMMCLVCAMCKDSSHFLFSLCTRSAVGLIGLTSGLTVRAEWCDVDAVWIEWTVVVRVGGPAGSPLMPESSRLPDAAFLMEKSWSRFATSWAAMRSWSWTMQGSDKAVSSRRMVRFCRFRSSLTSWALCLWNAASAWTPRSPAPSQSVASWSTSLERMPR